jgi:hypothetical protein
MAAYLASPVEVPIQVAGLDMIATVGIVSYVPPFKGDWDEPAHDGELEFEVEVLRLDKESARDVLVTVELSRLFDDSPDIRAACLEAIADHNQPPED